MQLKNIAITGGSGMLGHAVKKHLLEQNISCLDITREMWDLNNWLSDSEITSLLKNVDAIIHMAAFVPHTNENLTSSTLEQLFDINLKASLQLFFWCAKNDMPLVYLSSSAVYLKQDKIGITENDETSCHTFGGLYGLTKYLSEEMACNIFNDGRLVIMRPSAIYGPHLNNKFMVARFMADALNNKEIKLYSASSLINLVYSEDVAKAIVLALKTNSWGTFNIASDKLYTLKDIAKTCITIADRGSFVVENDDKSFVRYALDITRAKTEFEYAPSFSLEKGLELMKQQILNTKV